MNPKSESKKLRYKQSLSTMSNMDRQLIRQKFRQKFSVMKTKKLVFWHLNSGCFLKTTETPVFMVSLLRFFDKILT